MYMLWIDALQFEKRGGWVAETQFVREMGQGYLLALKAPGYPVDDAATKFAVPHEGTYRVWVRTKNWLREHAPGRFLAKVDAERIGGELGDMPSSIWCWQIAGDAKLSAGEHTLEMQDTTGYFPRFAAVLITDDMDYTPSPEWERIRPERARLLGQSDEIREEGPFDVVVAGAGPGGVPAAIAAARGGAKVALVHSRPVIGGNASGEAGVGFDGAYVHHAGLRESGIAEELHRVKASGGLSWQKALEVLCQGEPNLTLFTDECVIDARMEGSRIAAAIAQNTVTSVRTAFRGKMFIDATGDGWLGYYAGAAHRVGREAQWQHGEGKAPRNADGRTMSGCLMGGGVSFRAEDCGEPAPFCAPKWAQVLPRELHRDPGHNVSSGHWWIENPTNYDDLFEGEMVRDQLMIISLGFFHWLKNDYARRDLAINQRIVAFPRYNAKRESRRLIGDYILKQDDCTSGRPFDDVIAYAGWTIDVHNQDGIFSGLAGPYDFDIRVPINQVPYRCLYSKNVDNLLMAGRCISVSHIALGTIRVQNTLAMIGQAAGTAAAMAARQGITPREIGQKHIRALQQQLLRDDQYLPGLRNEDPDDLARGAALSATSVSTRERFERKRGIPGELRTLSQAYCMTFREKPTRALQLYLQGGSGDTKLAYEWVTFDNADVQDVVAAGEIAVPARFDGFVEIPLGGSFSAEHAGLRLLPNEQLSVRDLIYAELGCKILTYRAPYWESSRGEPTHRSFVHGFVGDPVGPKADCSPENVVNGVARPLSEKEYAWVSDPAQALPQEITLAFAAPQDVAQVQIVFDTDLNNPKFAYEPVKIVRQLVKDYDILVDGNVAEEVRGNILRMRRHALQASGAREIAVRVLATWGDPSARIFEIRAY